MRIPKYNMYVCMYGCFWLITRKCTKTTKDSALFTNYTEVALHNSDNTYGYWSNIRHYYYTCSGSESSLSSCSNHNINSYYCVASNDDAGVRCLSNIGMFLSICFVIILSIKKVHHVHKMVI